MTDLRRHWGLDPAITFLNHGSFGACPRAVLERQRELRDRLESEPVRFFLREYPALLDAAREEVARFVGADPAELVFVQNATTGINAVLRSLSFAAGDELLVTDHEYKATRNALDFAAGLSGARVVAARVPFPLRSPREVSSAIADGVTPRTRLALVDHVTSPTGLVLPIREIIAALAERGVPVLVDGAHAPGMVPLDLGSLGAAYYAGNCHKWLSAPKGAGILWVRRDLQAGVRPAVIGHGASAPAGARSRFHLEFDWTGTADPTAILCVPEAIRFLGSLFPGGWPELMRRNRTLALEARGLLCEALSVRAPAPEEMIGSLAAVPLPDDPGARARSRGRSPFDTDPLQDLLLERHRIEVPIVSWPAPGKRLVRISAQAYNRREDYEGLARALREALAPPAA